ncbi:hypothetical protein C9974_12290 [Marinobacter sp. B9-2]|nr:hypothetical protein C9974_12290 [Marinobacter sp. B9-2]
MKKLSFLSAFVVLFAAIGLTSCDSEPVDPVLLDNQPQPTGPAVFKVDFSGETFTADETEAVIADGLIAIGGIQGNEQVSIVIPGTTVGTYDGAEVLMAYHPTLDSEYQYWNVDEELNPTGTVTITSIDTENHTISGTFSFTGYWSNMEENHPSIAFTNGSFQNIPYTGQPVDPVDEEFMTATVDGADKDFSVILAVEAGGMLTFSGTIVSPSSSIQFMVPTTITPGTYSLSGDEIDDPVGLYHGAGGTFPYSSVSGSLVITSNDGEYIEGTFEFVAEDPEGDSVEITDGEFSVALP